MDAQVMEAPASHAGIAVEALQTQGGLIQLRGSADHRIRLHASAPVRGHCRRERFVYTRGDLDIVVAGQSDQWEEDDPGLSVVVRFPPLLLERIAEEVGRGASGAGLQPRHQFRDPQIEHIVWALEAERHAGSPNGRLYRDGLGTALAAHLLGRYGVVAQAAARSLSAAQTRRVLDYIEAHLDQDLSLDVLAETAHYSTSHFKTLFKRTIGVAAHEYVMQRRVQRAKVLLQRGDLPASQVALETGFAHQSHMARCMRRLLGVSPGMLRRGAARH